MRKLFSVLLVLAFAGGVAQAQDLITKKNGEDIQAKILEVNQTELKYKRWDNLEGPTFTLPKSEILIVRYQNGTNEIFKSQAVVPAYSAYAAQQSAAGSVQPGMRYRDYRSFYDPRTYTHMPGDRYNPAVGGLCSWIIPGLGQMICGEVGRGFGFLGGVIGCSIFTSIGSVMAFDDLFELGIAMMVIGSAGMLALDICAIVDGVQVAKVKNMYERDMRGMADLSVKLEPYVATTNGLNRDVVAGAALRIRF